jgi:glycerol uptake facilitator-like aquaporin
MDMPRRLGAELLGTFWLTFAGCGSAVLAAGFPDLGIGFLGVSFAFGLTVLTIMRSATSPAVTSTARSRSGCGPAVDSSRAMSFDM